MKLRINCFISIFLSFVMIISTMPYILLPVLAEGGDAGIVQVSFGNGYTGILKTDGSLWMTGYNREGELGDGTSDYRSTPVKVMDSVAQVSCGASHTGILKTDGSLWMTGLNDGALGDGTTVAKHYPEKVMENVAQISCGAGYTGILKTDGSLWMTGANYYGQIGDGTNDDKLTPVKIMENVSSIDCVGSCTFILKNDDSLWVTGENVFGELGNGTSENINSPIKIAENVAQVSHGLYHTAILKKDGSLWMTGRNEDGQLGVGSSEDRYTPVKTPVKVMEGVAQVSCGVNHTGILKTDGSLWMTGHGDCIGDGTGDTEFIPIKIMEGVAQVSCGAIHTGILKTDGSLWMTGANYDGQIGDGTTKKKYSPIKIMENVTHVICNGNHTVLFTSDGSLLATGANEYGELGVGSTENVLSPLKIFLSDDNNDSVYTSQAQNISEDDLFEKYYPYLNNQAFKTINGNLVGLEEEIIWKKTENQVWLAGLRTALKQGSTGNIISFIQGALGITPKEDIQEEDIARELLLAVQGDSDALSAIISESNGKYEWLKFFNSASKGWFKTTSGMNAFIKQYCKFSGKSEDHAKKVIEQIIEDLYGDDISGAQTIFDLADVGMDLGDAIAVGLATEQINEDTVAHLIKVFRNYPDSPIYRGLIRVKNRMDNNVAMGYTVFAGKQLDNLMKDELKDIIKTGLGESIGAVVAWGDLACKLASNFIPSAEIKDLNKLAMCVRNYYTIDTALSAKYRDIALNYEENQGKNIKTLKEEYKLLYKLKVKTIDQAADYAEKVASKDQSGLIKARYAASKKYLDYDVYIENCLKNANAAYQYKIKNGSAVIVSKVNDYTLNRTLTKSAHLLKTTSSNDSWLFDIPASIDGHTVIGLDDNSFSNDDSLSCVFIPDTITSIGAGAFNTCSNLQYVFMGNSVGNVGEDSFTNCISLEEACISSKDTEFGEGCFSGCEDLIIRASGNSKAYTFANTNNIDATELEPVLTSIEIISLPTKTTYNIDEDLDTTGLTVDAIYDDGTRKNVTNQIICKLDDLSPGTHDVLVSYDGIETSFKVSINQGECDYAIRFVDENNNDIVEPVRRTADYGTKITVSSIKIGGYTALNDKAIITVGTDKEAIIYYTNGEKKDISLASVSIPKVAYSGTAQYPSVTVSQDNNLLIENVDYYMLYGENVENGLVVIEGIGEYTGSKEVQFEIEKDNNSSEGGESSGGGASGGGSAGGGSDAETTNDQAVADAAIAAINKIPTTVTIADKAAIEAARAAYHNLTADQKALISKEITDKLEAAEAALKRAEAIKTVEDLIDSLPDSSTVTTADKGAIESAQTAYDALSADEKASFRADKKAKLESAVKALANAELEEASNINKATVTKSDIQKASSLGATTITIGSKVKKISKYSFKGTSVKTLIVKTKKLTKSKVKGSLKGSKVKTIKVKVGSKKTNKKYVKKYKKIFTRKNAGKKVLVK